MRPVVSLQAAIGPGSMLNEFIIGSSLIGGPDVIAGTPIFGDGSWVELADRCDHISTRRGRQRLLQQYEAGELGALFDNSDGVLDPAWDAGPYSEGGVSTVRSGRAVKCEFTWSGDVHPCFYGYADLWNPVPSYPDGGAVALTSTDGFKILNRIVPLPQSPVGAGDDTGARIHRILDEAGWPAGMRDVDVGDYTHQATSLGSSSALAQMQLAAVPELSELYMDGRGWATFRRAFSRYTSFRSLTPQWVIGDGAGELNPATWQPANDDALVRNDVNVARIGGSVVTRRNAAGMTPATRATFTRTDLTLDDDGDVASFGDRVLDLFGDPPGPRVESVTFEPDGDEAMWPMIVGARFGDRVTCNLRHPVTGVLFGGDYFIEGIDHDIPVLQKGGKWRTVFSLASAAKFPTNPFIIGVSLIGGTDVIT